MSHDCRVIKTDTLSCIDGEWEKVDETLVGLKGSKSFFETKDFLIDPAVPSSLVAQLNIKIPGK